MTNEQIADVAEAVAHVFLIPGTWAQNNFALDEYGHVTGPRSKNACAWCLLGACEAAMPVNAVTEPFWRELRKWLNVSSFVEWNDNFGQTAENIANELFNFADYMRGRGGK